jgi:hypothetical protein
MLRRWEVDGLGTGRTCPMSGLGISRVESSGSGNIQLTVQFSSLFKRGNLRAKGPTSKSAQQDKIRTKNGKLE